MDAPHCSHWLPAVALFVACTALQHAQPAVTPAQSLAADSTATALPSGLRPRALVDPALPAPSLEQRGDILEMSRQYQAAVQAYAQIQQPSATVWNKMGIAYQMLFDLQDAARCYKESLKLDPDNSHALNDLATVEDSLKDFSSAEHYYKQALRLNPRSALYLKNLGTNLLMQHEYGRGSDAYAQALAIDPHIFDTHSGPSIEFPGPVQEHGTASYFKARSCARAGLTGCAVVYLRRAFDEGGATLQKVANENDFESMRGMPEFEHILGEQK